MSGFAKRQLDIGSKQPLHKYKLCNKCDVEKPPEGGIDMGHKWICAHCWVARKTSSNLRENRR
jgi:hypothetical protein